MKLLTLPLIAALAACVAAAPAVEHSEHAIVERAPGPCGYCFRALRRLR